jgi:hypothetical protein
VENLQNKEDHETLLKRPSDSMASVLLLPHGELLTFYAMTPGQMVDFSRFSKALHGSYTKLSPSAEATTKQGQSIH